MRNSSPNNLPKIIKIISDPSSVDYGISIKNMVTGKWLCKFSDIARMKSKGYDGIEDYLNDLHTKGYNNINVHLKKRQGTANRTIYEALLVTENTNLAVSQEGNEAINNVASAPSSLNMPIENNKEMAENGLMGMMANVPQPMFDMYSDARNHQKASDEANKWEKEAKDLDKELRRLQDENREQRFDIKNLEAKLESKKKPLVSPESVAMASEFLPALLGMFNGGSKGLNAPQQQVEESKKVFSKRKQEFLKMLENDKFDDSYCDLMQGVIDKLAMNPEFSNELVQLIQ